MGWFQGHHTARVYDESTTADPGTGCERGGDLVPGPGVLHSGGGFFAIVYVLSSCSAFYGLALVQNLTRFVEVYRDGQASHAQVIFSCGSNMKHNFHKLKLVTMAPSRFQSTESSRSF